MPETISTGIVCPSCGRKEAVIEREFLVKEKSPTKRKIGLYELNQMEDNQVRIFHPLCGYQKTLHVYLKTFIDPNRVNLDSHHIVNRILSTRSYKEDISPVIKDILLSTNGYFVDHLFSFCSESLIDLVCPFCQQSHFVGASEYVVCQCGHFQIPASLYLISSIQNPYEIERYRPSDDLLYYISIKVPNKPRDGGIHKVIIARLVYRYNKMKDERVLVIDKASDASAKEYQKLLDTLPKNLDGLFTIIEKVKPE